MLPDVEEGNNLILTRFVWRISPPKPPLATGLIDTKQQSATTSYSTQIVQSARCTSRESYPCQKKRLLGKRYQRNEIYLHWTKPKIFV